MVPGRFVATFLLLVAAARADVAVPETGPVFKGAVKVVPESNEAILGEAKRPLGEILLIERDDGTLVWSAGFERRIAGYRRLIHEGRRARLLEMIGAATKAKDPELARRVLDLACAEGFSGKEADIQRRRVENLEKRPGKRDEARASEVRRAAAGLDDELPDLLVARAKGDKDVDGLRLLREALRARPAHGGALTLLADRAPKPQPFPDLLTWLDWSIGFERHGFKLAPEDHPELKKARHYWRPDLVGIVSTEVFVITPLREMAPLREVVLRVHLACAKLRELFRTDKPLLRPDAPLLVYFYANKDNYKEALDHPVTNRLPPYFQFANARFDRQKDVTQVLWSAAEKDRPQIFYGAVHSIVRHWLWTRNPRYTITETNAANPDVAGYWAETGLPAVIAEAAFDLDKLSIDLAAGSVAARKYVREHARDLLPWGPLFLYGMSDLDLMNHGDAKRGDDWASWVFDRQATVVCHFLIAADGGSRRGAFLDFFVHRCRGDQPKLAPKVAFGMTADELGNAALIWASR